MSGSDHYNYATSHPRWWREWCNSLKDSWYPHMIRGTGEHIYHEGWKIRLLAILQMDFERLNK